MKSITAKGYKVEFTKKQYIILNDFVESQQYSSVFVLADTNTEEHCLPLFLSNLSPKLPLRLFLLKLEKKTKTLKPVQVFGMCFLNLVQIVKAS